MSYTKHNFKNNDILDASQLNEMDTKIFENDSFLQTIKPIVSNNPENFGAVGDGKTDDTIALQKAINEGGTINLTSGKKYKITKALMITKSNTIINGNGATILNYVQGGVFIYAKGTLDSTVLNLTEDITSGVKRNNENTADILYYTNIKYSPAYEFKTGDTIIIQSQRDALSQDSGLYWCGSATGSATHTHWAEPLTINEKVGTNEINCTGTLIFPSYLSHKEDGVDVSSQAYDCSRIRKVNFLRGIHIRDINVEGYYSPASKTTLNSKNETVYSFSGNDNSIRFDLCRDSSIKNVSIKKLGTISHGRCFMFNNCWNCTYDNCVADASDVFCDDYLETHTYDNHFTFTSCWDCSAVECTSYHAGQSFDVTYNTSETTSLINCPSIGINIYKCKVHGSSDSAVTTHSGSMFINIDSCVITNCARPVAIRTPFTNVTNCTIACSSSSNFESKHYAIDLDEPTIFNNIVSGNRIFGGKGLLVHPYVNRSDKPTDTNSVLGITICDNTFQNTIGGIYLARENTWKQTEDMCVDIRNNYFRGTKVNPVLLLSGIYNRGITFSDNTLISCDSNCYDEGNNKIIIASSESEKPLSQHNNVYIYDNRVISCDYVETTIPKLSKINVLHAQSSMSATRADVALTSSTAEEANYIKNKQVSSTTDLNTIKASGWYYIFASSQDTNVYSTELHRPTFTNAFMEVFSMKYDSSSTFAVQIFHEGSGISNRTWKRTYYNGKDWSEWKLLSNE